MFNSVIFACIIAAAVCGIVGFKKYAWFLSVGFGLSVFGCGAVLLVFAVMKGSSNLPLYLHCALLVLYGARLGLFLYRREQRLRGMKKLVGSDKGLRVPVPASLLTWLLTAFLTAAQVSPMAYRIHNEVTASTMQWVGFILTALGLLIEVIADSQKSKAKALASGAPVMTGLYRLVRCPNYLGEVILWLGVFLSGIGTVRELQWILPIIGWLYMNGVILTYVRKICVRQNKAYAALAEFSSYTKRVPVLLPLIPWHIAAARKKSENA